jgi:hypothetical protein
MSTETQTAAPTGSNVILVACKLAHGLKMEIGRPGDENYATHTLKGVAQKGAIVNESGFTLNRIPAKFWNDWLEWSPRGADGKISVKTPNKRLDCITRGFVFAHPEEASVEAYTQGMAKARTGLEPIDPSKLPKGLEPMKREE